MKRVSLITLSNRCSSQFAEENQENSITDQQLVAVERLEVELVNDINDDEKYTEVSYKKLKSKSSKDAIDGHENDENISPNSKKMAEYLESKFGTNWRRRLVDDCVDKGLGYDTSDSFIDNKEAYDELMPSTITTEQIGFYVNSGPLKFRSIIEEADDEPMLNESIKSGPTKGIIRKKKAKDSPNPARKRGRFVAWDSIVVSASVNAIVESVARGDDLLTTTCEREDSQLSDSSDNSSIVFVCDVLPELNS